MRRSALVLIAAFAMLASLALPAGADHTDPDNVLTLTPREGVPGIPGTGVTTGEGDWEHLRNFPAHQASDVKFFTKDEVTYAVQGTLGQGPRGTNFVGQRIIEVVRDGIVADPPRIRADHGSAACEFEPIPPATSATGLQHDVFATPLQDPELLLDATDATGRCHDTSGGGIELIDISDINDPEFEPREVHLVRFTGFTHTLTVDPERPWIVFSNSSDASTNNFLDFMDIRSCLTASEGVPGTLPADADLETKREQCQPVVYRIPFEDVWTQGTLDEDGEPQGSSAACHDTVIEDNVIYCSGLNADLLLDISDLTDEDGTPHGEPLSCAEELLAGTNSTEAMVTNCAVTKADGETDGNFATGWKYMGHYNHPGRTADNSNSNLRVPADRGVAVSHETRPFPTAVTGDRRFMVTSDERGGGVIPGGATCTDDNFDVYGHGGLHFLDITDPSDITYAEMVDESGETIMDGDEPAKAFWRGEVVRPRPTFCVVHRFRLLPDEQRMIVGYYTQGVKILDYEIDEQGRFSFEEVASFQFENANTWTADAFHVVDTDEVDDEGNQIRTYYLAMSDTLAAGQLGRGMDIVSWTGPMATPIEQVEPEPEPTDPPVDTPTPPATDVTVERIAGNNRITTAIEISKATYDSADTVVIARADEFADALAGAPLARQLEAPILLTNSDRLLPEVEAEIERLGANRAVLLGGEAALQPAVANRLRAMDVEVERVFGPNRFGTAARIAERMGGDFDTVFLTEGIHANPDRGWPDAMSAAPYAAFTSQPVLLTDRNILPPETRQALSATDPDETIVVGGSAAVSDSIVQQVRADGHNPRRLAGGNRFETSVAVYNEGVQAGMDQSTLWAATGLNWPDALTGGAAVGALGETLVLVAGNDLANSPATRDLIAANRDTIERVNLLGGTAAISQRVADQIEATFDDENDGGSTAAAVPASSNPLGGSGSPLGADTALLLAGLALLPAAALFGRRRRRLPSPAVAWLIR